MSKKRFDEAWLKEYQERTGCKVVQTGGRLDAEPVCTRALEPGELVLSKQDIEGMKDLARMVSELPSDMPPLHTLSEIRLDFPEDAKKPRKYGNEPVTHGGKRFDSKHEARVYEQLRLSGLAGAHVGLARQVCFFLPGGVRYYADFVTLHADGSYRVLDAKSAATRKNAVYRLKKRQMKACLGLEIEEV